MRPTPLVRDLLLQEFGQCLMRLVEARRAGDALDALAGLMLGLPLTWYAVDLYEASQARRRLASHRCPRGFSPFVSRLGFLKRPDGTYHGTFADSTLLLVKVSEQASAERSLLAVAAFSKTSPLNDGPTGGTMGALVHETLSRALWFEAHARRARMLEACASDQNELLALLDANGGIIEQYPQGGDSLPAALLQPADGERGRSRASQIVPAADGRAYDAHTQWLAGDARLDARYRLVRARRRTPMPPSVLERLRTFGLSKRESEVAELVFTGQTNQLIADTLYISRDTVKTHCRHIFGKLGISRRTEFLRVMSRT